MTLQVVFKVCFKVLLSAVLQHPDSYCLVLQYLVYSHFTLAYHVMSVMWASWSIPVLRTDQCVYVTFLVDHNGVCLVLHFIPGAIPPQGLVVYSLLALV